jgi:phage shock protein C
MDSQRFVRSQKDRMLGGVCGGLAQYLRLDSTLVRLFFVIFTITGGFGVLMYFILWIVIPNEDDTNAASSGQPFQPDDLGERARSMGADIRQAVRQPGTNKAKFVGIALILAGVVFLLQNLNLPELFWLKKEFVWPALLVVAGAALVIRALRKD